MLYFGPYMIAFEMNFFRNDWCDLVIYSDGFEVSSCHIGLVLE